MMASQTIRTDLIDVKRTHAAAYALLNIYSSPSVCHQQKSEVVNRCLSFDDNLVFAFVSVCHWMKWSDPLLCQLQKLIAADMDRSIYVSPLFTLIQTVNIELRSKLFSLVTSSTHSSTCARPMHVVWVRITSGELSDSPSISRNTESNSTVSQQVVICVGLPLLVSGVVGNSLAALVFLSLETFRHSSCAFYLTVMSFVNTLHLLTGSNINWLNMSIASYKYRMYAIQLCVLVSCTCMCLATIDQFLATCSQEQRHSGSYWAFQFWFPVIIRRHLHH